MPKDTALAAVPPEEGSNVEVDIDLDDLDEQLRAEALGQPIAVRVGGKIIHIEHAGDWSQTAMQAASAGDWAIWARQVINDDDEFQAWMDLDLKNYQIEAIFNEAGRQARLNRGKSKRRSGSSNSGRRS